MPPVGSQEAKTPEAESSVAFEAPAEELNLTLVTDTFLLFIQRNINVDITKIWQGVWGTKFAAWGLSPQAPLVLVPDSQASTWSVLRERSCGTQIKCHGDMAGLGLGLELQLGQLRFRVRF